MPLVRLLTAGLLPARIRREYGLPWGRMRARRFELVLGVVAAVYRRLPRRVRQWPMRHYLKGV
jgi:uncharacterized protein (DUF2236 family)